MKRGFIALVFLTGLIQFGLIAGPKKPIDSRTKTTKVLSDTTTYFNVNNINMLMRNSGQLIDATNGAGFEWPKGSLKQVVYASGLWIGGKVGGNLRIAAVQYDTSCFQPGTMKGGVAANPANQLFRFYKLAKTDTTGVSDYDNWPISQGAPSVAGKPVKKGDQNIWCVYNDGRLGNREFYTPPLMVEVQQYVYGNSSSDDLNNTVFSEFKIINRDSLPIDSAYVSLWIDMDLGGPDDDASGVDQSLGLGYTYNKNTSDGQYGSTPPAVGLLVLRAPAGIAANDPNSFVSYDPTTQFPGNADEGFNYLKGLNKNGTSIIDPTTLSATRFMFSGDPVASTGWVDPTAGDKVILLSYGPFSIATGDSTNFHTALIVARGSDRLNSVTLLKQAVPLVQSHYNAKLVSVADEKELPSDYTLRQNYPNPFNPNTNFGFRISDFGFVSLKVYDALGQEIAVLVNEVKQPGDYNVQWDASGLPSGVYFYRLTAGNIVESRKLVLMK